jgi:hypothetical protein
MVLDRQEFPSSAQELPLQGSIGADFAGQIAALSLAR